MKEHVIPFFEAVAKLDLFGEVFWHSDFSVLAVICNDVFWWGCADLEQVESLEDIELLVKSCEDAKYDGAILYCARKRGMRPQGAMYKHINKEIHHLFNECGPEREIDFLNPENKDGQYMYSKTEQSV
jgi:hypothetical protein